MLLLDPVRRQRFLAGLAPELPGPLIAPHVRRTGRGCCLVDRWPDPRASVVGVAENYSFAGEPEALAAAPLAQRVAGLIEAPPAFLPLLRQAWPDLRVWDRVILELPGAPRETAPPGAELRRLDGGDAYRLWGLGADLRWISETLGGPEGLCASGLAWGAFVSDELAAVATPFFLGAHYEDIGIVTEPGFRGRGLAPACAARVAADVRRRGRIPSWSTSPDNLPSLRVARKLGFVEQRRDCLYVANRPIPESARPGTS